MIFNKTHFNYQLTGTHTERTVSNRAGLKLTGHPIIYGLKDAD